jgi:glycosyltransferase involved in cell wall biosynthesis
MTTADTQDHVISIVTPSLNQGEFIEETIRSVLCQAGAFYIDYIINDGGSSDDSIRIIQLYESLLKENCDVIDRSGLQFYVQRNSAFEWNRCLGISYRWVSEKDQGQSDAINKGMHAAKGKIAAFINSDDVYYPGTFRDVFEMDWSEADFVYGKGMWMSGKGRDLLYYPTFKPTRYSLYYQCTLCQPTVFFRRDAFNRLGGFSLRYHCAFDYEYWLRAIFGNCGFKYLGKPLARSRMYETNKSLRGKSLVSDEVSELRRAYYDDSSDRLNRFWLWINWLTVQKATERRVSRLNRLLGQHN